MNAPIPFRWRRAVALGLASLSLGGATSAADPWPDPPPRPVRTVEILHGTTRVWPPPAPPAPLAQPGAKPAPEMRPPQIWEDPPPRVWEEPRQTPKPQAENPVVEFRPIILTGHSVAGVPFGPGGGSAPWLNPAPAAPLPVGPVAPAQLPPATPAPIHIQAPAVPAQPPQPTVVVVREPADPRPVYAPPEQPRGITLGNETLLGIALGATGLGFGYAGWRRKSATAAAATAAVAAATPPGQPDGVLLMGKYNAGPRKETAERFEIGMSYEVEQQEKKKTAEQEQAAVLEFILSQNIALHADLAADPPEVEPAATDEKPDERAT